MTRPAAVRPLSRLQQKCQAIHAACGKKDLNFDDATRRDIIERFAGAGKRSTLDLDMNTADQVLDYLKAQGAKVNGKVGGPIRVSPEKAGYLSKIGALLADQKKPWSYAHTIAKHNFGKDRVEWLPASQMRGLIAQLVKAGAAMPAKGEAAAPVED